MHLHTTTTIQSALSATCMCGGLTATIRFIHRDRKIGVANRLTVEVLDADRFINQK